MEKKINISKIIITVLILIAIIIMGVILFTRKSNNGEETKIITSSEFENLEVKSIKIRYDEKTEETVINAKIGNSTKQEVSNETVNVILLGKDNVALTSIQLYISYIEPNGEHSLDASIKGNFTETTKIELQRPIVSQ